MCICCKNTLLFTGMLLIEVDFKKMVVDVVANLFAVIVKGHRFVELGI